VMVSNGRPWFDLKAVCQAVGVKDVEAEAARLDDKHVTCVETYGEDGSMSSRIIKCSVEGLDAILDRRQASDYKAWLIDVVMPAVHCAMQIVERVAQDAAALRVVVGGVDWFIDALDSGPGR
ncbi:MAG: BRO-N domain-containing protein, partial [Sulfuriferula sp.]